MTTIKLKNGSGAPTAGDLVQGEPALDLTNKRLYTEDSGGTVIEVGTNPGTDVTFADNRKAIFGAGSDLQIYHDGTDSYVDDQGTGRLRLRGASQIILEHPTNGETYAAFQANGASTLYYDNAAKLATTSTGIDVTGSVTADSLTVDGLFSLNSNMQQTSAAPRIELFETDATDLNTRIWQTGGDLRIYTLSDDSTSSTERIRLDHATGDLSLYNSAGTSQDLYWDASTSQLGLGVTSPSNTLHIKSSNPTIRLEDSDGSGAGIAQIQNTASGNLRLIADPSSTGASSSSIEFEVDGSEHMRLTSAGNVGIGTTSPTALFDATAASTGLVANFRGGASNRNLQISSFDVGANVNAGYQLNATSGTGALSFAVAGTDAVYINSSGNVGIGTTSPSFYQGSGLEIERAGIATVRLQNTTSGKSAELKIDADLTLETINTGSNILFNTGATERMRIDSSGNLLVGCTAKPSASVVGTMISRDLDAEGNKTSTSLTTAATHFVFFNPNGAVGSISTSGSATAYNTSSDQRLKENIIDAPSASDDIDAIQVRSFDWKADGSHQKYGMIAQELNTVAPQAVTIPDDPEEMAGVDYSKLVPMLVKEIQSLRARVAQLEGAN